MIDFKAAPTRRGVIAGLAATMLLSARAWAGAPARATLPPADQAQLDKIQAYLNGIKTVTGKFEQTNPDGGVSTGTVWLSRPGKMRFDYDPPTKLQVVCDGEFIEVNDKAAGDIQYLPVRDTPAWLILRDGITLSGDVTVTKFEHGPKVFRVTATQSKDESDSSLTMVFAEDPLALKQWTVVDPEGRATTVALVDLRDTGTVAADTFVLPDRSSAEKRGRGR
jgi:outer membrane lipoprotein-sorting protein